MVPNIAMFIDHADLWVDYFLIYHTSPLCISVICETRSLWLVQKSEFKNPGLAMCVNIARLE